MPPEQQFQPKTGQKNGPTVARFDPGTAAKKLLREGRSGALASLMAGSGHGVPAR